MKSLENIKEMLCKELEEIARKPEMGAGDLEIVHKLTDTIKNIDKICMLEDGDYSEDGGWEMPGRGSYGRGSSYANRGRHYVRGHYSRADGYGDGGNRGGRGYSRDDGRDYMMEQMERLMQESDNEKERSIIRRCMTQLENV